MKYSAAVSSKNGVVGSSGRKMPRMPKVKEIVPSVI